MSEALKKEVAALKKENKALKAKLAPFAEMAKEQKRVKETMVTVTRTRNKEAKTIEVSLEDAVNMEKNGWTRV